MSINFDEEKTVSAEQLDDISKLANMQLIAESNVADCEITLKRAKAELRQVQERDLPEAMKAVGMQSFKLATGESIVIDKTLFASIAKKNKPEAIRWLMAHGHGSLVKEDVSIPFEKGDAELVRQLINLLDANGFNTYSVNENVNTASVKSLIKELLGDGEEVPLELFGAYFATKAKVVR